MAGRAKFRLQVASLRRMLFDSEVESVYLSGDEGEFELLAYHHPLLGALPEGLVKIYGHPSIPVRAGAVMFTENTCVIIIEEMDPSQVALRFRGESDIMVT